MEIVDCSLDGLVAQFLHVVHQPLATGADEPEGKNAHSALGVHGGWHPALTLSLSLLVPGAAHLLLAAVLLVLYHEHRAVGEDRPLRQRQIAAFFMPMVFTTVMFTLSRPITIEKAKPLRLRYGLWVHARAVKREQIETRWQGFARTKLPAMVRTRR